MEASNETRIKSTNTNILGIKKPMLLKAIQEKRPHTYIEIGVFNCDTFFSVVDIMNHPVDCFLGFDLFEDPRVVDGEAPPPAEWCPRTVDFKDATEMARLKGKQVCLVRGDTKETLLSTLMDYRNFLRQPIFVFLDGGHSYDTCYADIMNTWVGLRMFSNTTVWIDDSNFPGVAAAINTFRSTAIRENYPCNISNLPYHLTEITW